jgi:glycosyltransferase involved in cell wall biosynthesis
LSRAGYNVTLVATYSKDEEVNGVKIVSLEKPKNRINRIFRLSIEAYLKALKQNADVYHFHDPELLPMVVFLKIVSRKKIIYDVHEDYGKQVLSKPYLPKITRIPISRLINGIEYLSTKVIDGIATATDDILKKFSYHPNAVSIKNYPVLSYFDHDNDSLNAERENDKTFNLVYSGNISRERGLNEMVEALSYIDLPVKLSFIGSDDPDISELKKKNVKGLDKTEFLGWVEHKKVPQLLKQFDVGMACLHPMPNYITALPIKIFEYMASGIPVIASNFPILKEIVEGNNCGICVDPLNPGEIAKAVQFLIDNEEERIKMGSNGKKAVMEKYNWDNECRKLITFYELILS